MEKTIKIFILTYNAPEDLKNNLASLFNSDTLFKHIEVNVINNHSDIFEIPK